MTHIYNPSANDFFFHELPDAIIKHAFVELGELHDTFNMVLDKLSLFILQWQVSQELEPLLKLLQVHDHMLMLLNEVEYIPQIMNIS